MPDDRVKGKAKPYSDGALMNDDAGVTPDLHNLASKKGLEDDL